MMIIDYICMDELRLITVDCVVLVAMPYTAINYRCNILLSITPVIQYITLLYINYVA